MSEIEMFCFIGIMVLAIMGILGVNATFLLGATCVLLVLSIIDIIKSESERRIKK